MVRLDIGCGAIDVWVESNGQKLEEFGLEAPNGPSKQGCYIASREDQSFSVNWKTLELPTMDQCADIFLDGVWVRGGILNTGAHATKQNHGVLVSSNQERKFSFGKLILMEENDSISDTPHEHGHEDLGTIRVQLQAILIGTTSHYIPRPLNLPGEKPISEKAKKAGAHAARLGEATTVSTAPSYSKTTPLHAWPTHDVTFHYAPLDYLQARDIIPKEKRPKKEPSSPKAGPSNSQQGDSKKRSHDIIVISSDEDEDEDSSIGADDDGNDSTGLTAEEKKELSRLQAKRRARIRKGKQRADSTAVKKAKIELVDWHFDKNELVVLSD